MSSDVFTVFMGGSRLPLRVSEEGFAIASDPPTPLVPWAQITGLAHPNPASVSVTLLEGQRLDFAFLNRAERDRFTAAADHADVSPAAVLRADQSSRARAMPMLTITEVPGRQIVEVCGFVTSQSVMSRQLFSDAGSELKSLVGGSLAGMERAVGDAIAAARRDLAQAARSARADTVIGVSVAIAGLGEKAEVVVLSGTAVRTASEPLSLDLPNSV